MPTGDNLIWKAHQEIDDLPNLAQFEDATLAAKVKSYWRKARATLSDVEDAAALPDDFTPPILFFSSLGCDRNSSIARSHDGDSPFCDGNGDCVRNDA
jgi:hypothetical protein